MSPDFLASAWALACVTRVVFPGSTRATRVMAFRQRSGTRPLKVVVAVAFAVRLAKLLPASPCSLTPPDGMVRVYHYTNKAGYEGIHRSGYIRPSDIIQGDASFGSSVYATELDPSIPFWDILKNNYDKDGGIQGRGESMMDRAEYVFAFDMSNSSVEFIDNDGRRSVLCIGGGDEVKVDDALYSGKAAVAADVLKNKWEKVVVYHYTNKEGYESILANGYISPENIAFPDDASDFQVSGVRGILAHPSTPIYTILHNMYGTEGKVGRFYGRGEDMFDRADYVFAFLLPVDMVVSEWESTFRRGARFWSIGRGKKVDITEAFYHGPAADAFDGNGLNHSVFESKEEVEMYLQIQNAVNPKMSNVATTLVYLPTVRWLLHSLTPPAGWVRVYHYTNKAGYEGIHRSGYIRPSDIIQGDASFGSSVYATELDPSIPFWDILKNNYDKDGGIQGRGESMMDRAEYVFAFDMSNSSVEFIDNDGRRSVLCIGGGDEVKVDDALYSGKAAVAADVLKNKGEKVVVYHYTNKEGYESILANGYISPENITFPDDASDFQVSGVRGILAHPSTPIYTILHNMYGTEGKVGRFYGRGEDMFDRADYVFAFLLPVDMVVSEWESTFPRGARFWSIGRGKRVDITEAFYHGPTADAFDGNGLNHSVFESEEEVRMYLQIHDSLRKGSQIDGIGWTVALANSCLRR